MGWKQDDPYPGGTGAIGRQFADTDIDGVRRYDHVKPTPRGWMLLAPFKGNALALQGPVAVALESGARMLEARCWNLSDNRVVESVSDYMASLDGEPFRYVIALWVWLRK